MIPSPEIESRSRPGSGGTSWILTTAMTDKCPTDRRASTYTRFSQRLRRSRRLRAARRAGWLVAAILPAMVATGIALLWHLSVPSESLIAPKNGRSR